MNYKIIANNIELDTIDLPISINYELDHILNPNKRQGNWTKTIILPGTKKNNLFFKQTFNVNVDKSEFNTFKRIPAMITSNTGVLFRGSLKLLNIKHNQNDLEYEINIVGESTSLFSNISDKLLEDINLSEYNHIRDRDTIIKSFNYINYKNNDLVNNGGPGDGYVYPYIVYGGSTDITNSWNIYDAYPAVYLKTVIDKIISDSGYVYKSKFFNSEYFKKLIIPFTNGTLQYDNEQLNNLQVVVGFNEEFNPATGLVGQGGSINNNNLLLGFNRETGEYVNINFTDQLNQFDGGNITIDSNGFYDINFNAPIGFYYWNENGEEANYVEGSSELNYQAWLYKNGQLLTTQYSTLTPPSGNLHDTITNLDLEINLTASNVYCQAGDTIYVRIVFNHPSGVQWTDGQDDHVFVQMMFEQVRGGDRWTNFGLKLSSNNMMGINNINMNNILPKNFKQVDLLQDVCNIFNLVIADDSTQENGLLIEPRDSYFNSKTKILDWETEKKLDYSETYTQYPITDIDWNNYLFTYNEDSDYFNEIYTEQEKQIYGELQISLENEWSNETEELKLKFSPTVNSEEFLDGRCAPFFITRNEAEFKAKQVKPRLLFYGGVLPCSLLRLQDGLNAPYDDLTEYPYCGMWDNPFEPTETLEFGNSSAVYWNTENFTNNNLYERFHKQSFQNLVDSNSEIFEGYFYLTNKDIIDFDFRDVVFLMGQYWRVLEISNFDPSSNLTTKVKLIKIINYEILDKATIQILDTNQSCPVDIVVRQKGNRYIYTSLSGNIITKDCCDSRGGTWMEGTCYVNFDLENGTVRPIFNPKPISLPFGPIKQTVNNNTILSPGVKVYGENNYVNSNVKNGIVVGDNITIANNVNNVLAIGNDLNINDNGLWVESINGISTSSIVSGLPGVLSIDNTTGGNNIILTNDDVISNTSGDSSISLGNSINPSNIDIVTNKDINILADGQIRIKGELSGTIKEINLLSGYSEIKFTDGSNISRIQLSSNEVRNTSTDGVDTSVHKVLSSEIDSNVIVGDIQTNVNLNNTEVKISTTNITTNDNTTHKISETNSSIKSENSTDSMEFIIEPNVVEFKDELSNTLLKINKDGLVLPKFFTPTSSLDTTGEVGQITLDDNYIYVKTSTGWKRISLSSF